MTTDRVFAWMSILSGFGGLLVSLELLAVRRHYTGSGLLSWDVLRTTRYTTAHGAAARVLDALFGAAGFALMQFVKAVSSIGMILDGMGLHAFAYAPLLWIALVVVCTGAFYLRSGYGVDGSDQMLMIVYLALFAHYLLPSSRLTTVTTIAFVAAQLTLSYVTAGVAKLISGDWRGGSGVVGIFSTKAYGAQWLAVALKRSRAFAFLLSWGVIVFECTFPLAFVSVRFAEVYCIVGFVFHFANAAVMGLNAFLWAFLSAYPAVWWVGSAIAGERLL